MRGNETRVQINKVNINNISVDIINLLLFAKNNLIVIDLMKIIILYSAIKIIENCPFEYSVLNPDTNSDSLSLRSNGVRLVSANMIMIQFTNNKAEFIDIMKFISKFILWVINVISMILGNKIISIVIS